MADASQQLIELARANSASPQALAGIIAVVARPREPDGEPGYALPESPPFPSP